MKKLVVIFVLLFSISLFTSDVFSQNGRSVKDIHLGVVATGDTFSVPTYSNFTVLGYAATFEKIGFSSFRIVHTNFGSDRETIIGEVATMNNSTREQVIYMIYAIAKR